MPTKREPPPPDDILGTSIQGWRWPWEPKNHGANNQTKIGSPNEVNMKPIPIANLPKDIERALIWGELSLGQEFDETDANRAWYTADWYGEKWGNYWRADGEGYVNGVTHWMTIPDPPQPS